MGVDPQLVNRWRSDEGHERVLAAVHAITANGSVADMAWGTVNGRWDLRGMPGPLPRRQHRREVAGYFVEELEGPLTFRGVTLQAIDLSGAQLESVRFFDVRAIDCRFDQARCQDWRVWGSSFNDCSFHGTDLRRSALGPWYEDRPNYYQSCDFGRCDLRGGSCTAARIVDCDLSHAKIDGIDFQSTSFVRVRFAGALRDVAFWDHGFRTGKPDPNEMEDVDFADAIFHDVDFRRVSLERVTFPNDAMHIVLRNYGCVLRAALAEISGDDSPNARVLRVLLEHRLKWIGDQAVNVFSLHDMEDPEGAELAAAVLRRAQRICS